MIIGALLMVFVTSLNPVVGLLGGIITFIGIISFGALLSYVAGIELGARALEARIQPPESFREQYDDYERTKNNGPEEE